MAHESGPSDFIAEWSRAEAEANAARAARTRSILLRVVAPLALVATMGGVAWGARDGSLAGWTATLQSWVPGAAESGPIAASNGCEPASAAWRRSCRRPGAEPGAGASCDAPEAAWRNACRAPAPGAELALRAGGPSTTGSLDPQNSAPPVRTAEAVPPAAKPDIVAQAAVPDAPTPKSPEAASAPAPSAGKPETSRAWVDPDIAPAAPAPVAAAPEPIEPVMDAAAAPVVLPPARPADPPKAAPERDARPKPAAPRPQTAEAKEPAEVAKPKIPERDARPKAAARPHVADSEDAAEAAKPKIPEREARPKPAPARPQVAEAEDAEEATPPVRRARPSRAAKPAATREAQAEPATNRQLRRRSKVAADLRERAGANPRRLVVRQAQEITEMEVEIRPGQEPIVRRRGPPIWVVEGQRTRARSIGEARPGGEFPSEFVQALRHYNTRSNLRAGDDFED